MVFIANLQAVAVAQAKQEKWPQATVREVRVGMVAYLLLQDHP
jgi:hypothetical protein